MRQWRRGGVGCGWAWTGAGGIGTGAGAFGAVALAEEREEREERTGEQCDAECWGGRPDLAARAKGRLRVLENRKYSLPSLLAAFQYTSTPCHVRRPSLPPEFSMKVVTWQLRERLS